MKRFASFILGAFVGAIAGSLAALLLAPSSGRTLQDQITESVNRVNNEVKQAAIEKRLQMENELTRLRQDKIKLE